MKFLFPLLLIVSAASSSPAAILANYAFASSTGPHTSSDSDPNSTASNFTAGAGIAVTSSSHAYISGSRSIHTFASTTDGTDVASTVAANDYFTFNVTATTGVLDLTQLSFFYGSSGGLHATVFVRSSVDDFDANIWTSSSYTVAGGTGSGSFVGSPAQIDLSAPAFQGLSSIEFRIYGWDNDNGTGTAGIRLDDVILTSVPEPSAAMLLCGGIFAAALRRSRRN